MGRPRGSKDKGPRFTTARKVAAQHAAQLIWSDGKTPLQIMLEDMRVKYDNGDLPGAATRAETCAPYIHARLSATTVTHRDALDELTPDELRALLIRAEAARPPLTIEHKPLDESGVSDDNSAEPKTD